MVSETRSKITMMAIHYSVSYYEALSIANVSHATNIHKNFKKADHQSHLCVQVSLVSVQLH